MVLITEIQKYKLPIPAIAPPIFLTDEQLLESKGGTMLFDCECYSNFFLVAFKCYHTGRIVTFERSASTDLNDRKLRWVLENFTLVGFNSINYDIPLVWAAANGFWTTELKNISDLIIKANCSIRQICEQFGYQISKCNHIDIQNVAPGFCSLKQYGARMHVKRLQDIPVNPDNALTESEATLVKYYCLNDLEITGWLYKYLERPTELRREMSYQYQIDLRSKSDAQLSEAVIANEILRATGVKPKRPRVDAKEVYRYNRPAYMRFTTQHLQNAIYEFESSQFKIDDSGKVILPESIKKLKLRIGATDYTVGVGGLHSCEKRMTVYSNDHTYLIDRDVESYYPAIILNQNLFPEHIGQAFVAIYGKLVRQRMDAKKGGMKSRSESLKIAINGCFGKLGNKYSCIYAPNLMIQVTLTGQLTLLMLIEMLEWHGIPVISGNTDGIVIKCPQVKLALMNDVIAQWENLTGFKTEETRYASIHSRDVNNYMAITLDGKVKTKGEYSLSRAFKDFERESLMKNPNAEICNEAIYQFLTTGASIRYTIGNCTDLRKFLFVQKVKGGAAKDRVYLGKTIRWFMRYQEFGSICYISSGNRVPDSAGGYPAMVLDDEFPAKQIDFDWYVRRANKMLAETGFFDSKQRELF